MVWYDIWYDMIYGVVWYGIWYDIWYDMIYDMIWYGMIWYDMIWYDMIWYDMIYDIWYMIYDIYIWYMIWYTIKYNKQYMSCKLFHTQESQKHGKNLVEVFVPTVMHKWHMCSGWTNVVATNSDECSPSWNWSLCPTLAESDIRSVAALLQFGSVAHSLPVGVS